jgi:hypothetical protein
LQHDDIKGINGFVMAYNEKMSFAMAHKKLSHILYVVPRVYTRNCTWELLLG